MRCTMFSVMMIDASTSNPTATASDPYNVLLGVSDDDGGTSGPYNVNFLVSNVAPALTVAGADCWPHASGRRVRRTRAGRRAWSLGMRRVLPVGERAAEKQRDGLKARPT